MNYKKCANARIYYLPKKNMNKILCLAIWIAEVGVSSEITLCGVNAEVMAAVVLQIIII